MKLIKIPFNGGALHKKQGIEKGPNKIIEKLNEIYMNEYLSEPIFKIEEVKVDNSNIEETNQRIFDKITKQEEKCIILGGDHSITYSSFKAFSKKNPKSGLIVFDAHPDLENNFNPPTHEDYLRVLIDDKIVNTDQIILIGLRNWHENEIKCIDCHNIRTYSVRDLFNSIDSMCDAIMEIGRKWDSLYISIDIDVLDPAFAPGTGHIEPGGLSSRELIYFIQRLKRLRNLKMIDIVEVNPDKDVNDMTSKIAAKLIVELS